MEKDKNKSSNSEPYSLKNLGLVDVKAAFSSLLQQIKEKTTPKSRTAVDKVIHSTSDEKFEEDLKRMTMEQVNEYFRESKQKKPKEEVITRVFAATQLYLDTFHPDMVEFIEENPDTTKLSSLIAASIAPYVADKVSGVGLSIIVALVTIYINLIVLRFIDSPKNDKEDDE